MREYFVVFLVAAAVTYLLTVVAREIAIRTGAVAKVRDRDVHAEPVPYLGGLAMLGGLFAAFLVARELPFLSGSQPFVFEDAFAVLAAGALVCAVGVLDDIFDLDALTKFGGQVVAVGVLVYSGIQFRYFFQRDGSQFVLDPTQGALLTAVIVLATVNAVNFIDGLDGLAAGVIGISALAFFLFCYQLTVINEVQRATTGALLSAALAGACAGFLVHNFHPARLFMGDSGSMLLGLVLSATGLTVTTQFSLIDIAEGADGARASLLPMLLPVALPILILVVPLADLLLAVVRRTAAGRSPFAPDKQHLHHRLLEIGHSHRRAVIIMWLWAGLIAFGTVVASLYDELAVWIGIGAAFVVTVGLTFLVPHLPSSGQVGEGGVESAGEGGDGPGPDPDSKTPQTL
ncbi:undecaprenyl/decaprenyl-phosphate alpha-N-acetylglucosaminyl 1-phosphate transferase [Nocardioides immobilis]|uniref:Undecaprenyl/decaprenyl-phosphate alpha-N-acetylglucosaminyl 1-phosphate transferase n=1 Tax=Nocardioides immobilis TaxID=2049295 RepID=A0A417Y2G4_9ACTN|nr:MraY family glycosyltransferase [Nocardioides immobilis]RHW26849.1 undecaprenyl/decaprenyl-phosphate alpha-N-acetylglucosaminyl 1-phosphate transferase [Nocardioides immobilis]